MGVDLGGVLLAKLLSGKLPTVLTPNDVGVKLGYVPGAFEWLSDCVHNYGPDNVYVVSFVQSIRLREVLAAFLYLPGGLLQIMGIERDHLVWANSKSDKWWAFVDKGLTHFTDDQVEVLVSIRACWERRRRFARPPALFRVPTAWRRSDFGGRVLMPPAPARAGRRIYPQVTGRVCPWDPG